MLLARLQRYQRLRTRRQELIAAAEKPKDSHDRARRPLPISPTCLRSFGTTRRVHGSDGGVARSRMAIARPVARMIQHNRLLAPSIACFTMWSIRWLRSDTLYPHEDWDPSANGSCIVKPDSRRK